MTLYLFLILPANQLINIVSSACIYKKKKNPWENGKLSLLLNTDNHLYTSIVNEIIRNSFIPVWALSKLPFTIHWDMSPHTEIRITCFFSIFTCTEGTRVLNYFTTSMHTVVLKLPSRRKWGSVNLRTELNVKSSSFLRFWIVHVSQCLGVSWLLVSPLTYVLFESVNAHLLLFYQVKI